jgi:hypothetical protein
MISSFSLPFSTLSQSRSRINATATVSEFWHFVNISQPLSWLMSCVIFITFKNKVLSSLQSPATGFLFLIILLIDIVDLWPMNSRFPERAFHFTRRDGDWRHLWSCGGVVSPKPLPTCKNMGCHKKLLQTGDDDK